MTPTPSENLGESTKAAILGESGVAEEKVFHARGGVFRRLLILVPLACFYETVTGRV